MTEMTPTFKKIVTIGTMSGEEGISQRGVQRRPSPLPLIPFDTLFRPAPLREQRGVNARVAGVHPSDDTIRHHACIGHPLQDPQLLSPVHTSPAIRVE